MRVKKRNEVRDSGNDDREAGKGRSCYNPAVVSDFNADLVLATDQSLDDALQLHAFFNLW
jgi:hypothetical protein